MNKLHMIKKIARFKLAQFESTNFVYNLIVAGFNRTPFKDLGRTHLEKDSIIVPVQITDDSYSHFSAYFQINTDGSFDLVVFYQNLRFKFKTTKYNNRDSSQVAHNMMDAFEEMEAEFDSFYNEKILKR